MPELYSCSITTISLLITDSRWGGSVRYPCASVAYDMVIDQIPTAKVYVSIGRYLDDPGESAPQRLLEWIQRRSDRETSDLFVKCSLLSDSRKGSTVIFSGYIVAGSYIYQTKGKANMMIEFTCMWSAAKLMTRPIASYMEVAMGSLINILQGRDNLDLESAIATTASLKQTVDISGVLNIMLMGKPITERLAYCIGALLSYAKYDQWSDPSFAPEPNAACMEAFGGKWRLKGGDGVTTTTDAAFTDTLWRTLINGMQNGSVIQAIIATLTSEEFGLQLVPRISCDAPMDFKLEICPMTAWLQTANGVPVLDNSSVIQLNASHNIVDRLNEPEVVIVNGAAAYGLANSDATKGIQGVYGIYAKNAELNAALQKSVGATTFPDLASRVDNMRVRTIFAPKWLDITGCAIDSRAVIYQGQDNRQNSGVIRQPSILDNQADNTMGIDKALIDINRAADNLQTAFGLYNQCAELLFNLWYRASDMASVELTPDMAFGGLYATEEIDKFPALENQLGQLIALDMSNIAADSSVHLIGRIRSLHYKYSAAVHSSASYTMVLDRVTMGKDLSGLPKTGNFPIYTR